jgi:hypothetical protein
MLYAKPSLSPVDATDRLEATPSTTAYCPQCDKPLIAKCGEIKIWHWAHKSRGDCDTSKEPETQWHLGWKKKFSKELVEITIGGHRADVSTKRTVIEFQHSPLSITDMKAREAHYDNLIWVVDGATVEDRLSFTVLNGTYGPFTSFKWVQPSATWQKATKPIYVDFGEKVGLFHIKSWSDYAYAMGYINDRRYGALTGIGNFVSYSNFISWAADVSKYAAPKKNSTTCQFCNSVSENTRLRGENLYVLLRDAFGKELAEHWLYVTERGAEWLLCNNCITYLATLKEYKENPRSYVRCSVCMQPTTYVIENIQDKVKFEVTRKPRYIVGKDAWTPEKSYTLVGHRKPLLSRLPLYFNDPRKPVCSCCAKEDTKYLAHVPVKEEHVQYNKSGYLILEPREDAIAGELQEWWHG